MNEIDALITKFRTDVDVGIDSFLSRKIPNDTSIERGFYDEIRKFVLQKAKRLRPICLLAAFEFVSRTCRIKSEYRSALDGALAIELLHNSTLVHDDMIDEDLSRRGQPTLHVTLRNYDALRTDRDRVGWSLALLAGTWLLVSGLGLLQNLSGDSKIILACTDVYRSTYEKLVQGEALDLLYEDKLDISVPMYLELVYLKTAALFCAAIQIGALIAGLGTDTLQLLTNFIRPMAQGFQLRDDILGTYGDERKIGKPVLSDILHKKKTILLVTALRNAKSADKELLESYLSKPQLSIEDATQIREIMERSNAYQDSLALEQELHNDSLRRLGECESILGLDGCNFFRELADLMIRREK